MKHLFYSIMIIIATAITSCQSSDKLGEIPIPFAEMSIVLLLSIIMGMGLLFGSWSTKLGFSKENDYVLRINLPRRKIQLILIALFIINISMLISSSWSIYHYYALLKQDWSSGSDIKNIFILFNIGVENTIATWYASMIFMQIGLILLIIFLYKKKSTMSPAQRKTVWGWLILSIFFIGLSADELGSIHERVGLFLYDHRLDLIVRGFNAVGIFLGIIAIIYMIWFSFKHLFNYGKSVLVLLLGVLVMMPVIIFEDGWDQKMRMLLETAADLKQIIFLSMLEEGLELFSSWIILVGFILFFFKLYSNKKDEESSTIKTLSIPVQPSFLIGGVQLLIGLAVIGVGIVAPILEFGIEGGDNGITRNWFPSALAFTGAFLVLIKWSTSKTKKRKHYLLLFSSLVILSVYHGSNFRFWLTTFESIPVSVLLIFHISFLLSIAIYMFISKLNSYSFWQKALFVLWFLGLSITLFSGEGPASPIDIFPFLFLFPFLISIIINKGDVVSEG